MRVEVAYTYVHMYAYLGNVIFITAGAWHMYIQTYVFIEKKL